MINNQTHGIMLKLIADYIYSVIDYFERMVDSENKTVQYTLKYNISCININVTVLEITH
jgi:hypothetical protein